MIDHQIVHSLNPSASCPLPSAFRGGSLGQVIVLAAEPGNSRQAVLQHWLATAQNNGANTWLLACDREEGGVWAGLKDWLAQLFPIIEKQAPHLIHRHSYELTMVLPSLRRSIPVNNPNLTDTAVGDEKVRNYPLDRAYRILHGLIDLLDEWSQWVGAPAWAIACDGYDRSGALVRRFFAELMRRKGPQMEMTLLLGIHPTTEETVVSQFPPQLLGQIIRLELPGDAEAAISPQVMAQMAQALEEKVGEDSLEREIYYPQLIRYWLQGDRPDRALIWQARALGICNHQGFYEDALTYAQAVAPSLEQLCAGNSETRWNLVGNLFGCYAALGDVERARQIVEQEALAKITEASQRVRVYYVMAMLHSRFLPNRDFARASDYLEQGLADLATIELPESERHFLTAFMQNGLAYVRHRQGQAQDAIALCRSASERLNTYLHPSRHRLHRSVLLYNIAQVYAAIERLDEAIEHYTAAIAMDSHYSEYYNERGNAYLKKGCLAEALENYLQAIKLSPPYAEVWNNIGLCYRLTGQAEEALKAYSVVLDLTPNDVSAWTSRAQAWEVLGQLERASADYQIALTLDPDDPLLLANQAVIFYDMGNLPAALSHLNRAIALAPETANLYQNRAVALIGMGRLNEAAQDLQRYLRLCPDAEDFQTVEEQLASLQRKCRKESPHG